MAQLVNNPVYTGFAMPIQPTHELYIKTLYPETDLDVVPTEKMIRAAAACLVRIPKSLYRRSNKDAHEFAEQILLEAFAAARVIKR